MKKLYFDINKCLACRSCEIACCVGHSAAKDLFKDIKDKTISHPSIKIAAAKEKNYPISCRNCDDPKCVAACMSAALTKDEKTGLVIHNKDKCVGCWMCVMVCPYGAVHPGFKDKIAVKCDMCADTEKPRCVAACPVKAIMWQEETEKVK